MPPPWSTGAGEEGLGPHPSALSPRRLGSGARGALEQVVLEAALGPCPLGRACRSSGLALRGFRPPAWLAGMLQVTSLFPQPAPRASTARTASTPASA